MGQNNHPIKQIPETLVDCCCYQEFNCNNTVVKFHNLKMKQQLHSDIQMDHQKWIMQEILDNGIMDHELKSSKMDNY